MNKYPTVIIHTAFALCCITAGILIAYFGEKYDNRTEISSSSVPVSVALTGPGHINCLPSIMDIQRELNRRGYKLKVDGLCGPATQSAWNTECANQYAKELMLQKE